MSDHGKELTWPCDGQRPTHKYVKLDDGKVKHVWPKRLPEAENFTFKGRARRGFFVGGKWYLGKCDGNGTKLPILEQPRSRFMLEYPPASRSRPKKRSKSMWDEEDDIVDWGEKPCFIPKPGAGDVTVLPSFYNGSMKSWVSPSRAQTTASARVATPGFYDQKRPANNLPPIIDASTENDNSDPAADILQRGKPYPAAVDNETENEEPNNNLQRGTLLQRGRSPTKSTSKAAKLSKIDLALNRLREMKAKAIAEEDFELCVKIRNAETEAKSLETQFKTLLMEKREAVRGNDLVRVEELKLQMANIKSQAISSLEVTNPKNDNSDPTAENETVEEGVFPSVVGRLGGGVEEDVDQVSVMSFQSSFSTSSSFIASKKTYSDYNNVSSKDFSVGFDRMNTAHKSKRVKAVRLSRKESYDRINSRGRKKYKDLTPAQIAEQWDKMKLKK